MASLNDALIIARSGVLTHQERMNVIAHNIANVDTPGYHRQKALLETNPPNQPNLYCSRDYDIGTGVHVQDIVRVYNDMKEDMLLDELSDSGMNDLLADMLADLEGLMGGADGSALAEDLQNFWDAWQNLANNADDLVFRQLVLDAAVQLTDQINTMADRLTQYREGIAEGVPGNFQGSLVIEVDEINSLAAQIQELNNRIYIGTNQGTSVNDLADTRDTLIRELREKIDVTVGQNGALTLDGQVFVSGNGQERNVLAISSVDPSIEFQLNDQGGALIAPVAVTSGRLGGWVQAAEYADAFHTQLDTFTTTLMTEVNTIHLSGYDLNGDPGIEFFVDSGVGTAADGIMVNTALHDPNFPTSALSDHPDLIAAANTLHDPGGPDEGPNVMDGANALEIADLCYTDHVGLNNQTLGEYLTLMYSDLGADVKAAAASVEDSEAIVRMLQDAIASESGVNLDEEMIDMIQAQRAYQACARMVTTVDEMLQVILSL